MMDIDGVSNKPANVSMRKIYDDMCIKMSYNFIYAYCVQQMSALGFFSNVKECGSVMFKGM